jgi:hypothetical protein
MSTALTQGVYNLFPPSLAFPRCASYGGAKPAFFTPPEGCLASSDLPLPLSPPLTSKRQTPDTAGSALTGRHQPAGREHSHLFV